MQVSDEIELSEETNLVKIDKDVYIEWLIKNIDNGGDIDNYDKKFKDDKWYYADG